MHGKVRLADNSADALTLEDGTLFYLGEGASMKGLKPGMAVIVTDDELAVSKSRARSQSKNSACRYRSAVQPAIVAEWNVTRFDRYT